MADVVVASMGLASLQGGTSWDIAGTQECTVLGTFSARVDKRGQFQHWTLSQYVTRKSFSGRDLLRLLGLTRPPKVSALSTHPGIGSEKVPRVGRATPTPCRTT
jgi:hypothetical protein